MWMCVCVCVDSEGRVGGLDGEREEERNGDKWARG